MGKNALIYGAVAAVLGYMTGGRAKKAKRTKAMLYGIGGAVLATQAPRFGISLPRLAA